MNYMLYLMELKLKFELNSKYEDSIEELSMGMSQDYLEAVKCGSTIIRLGKKYLIKEKLSYKGE